MRNLRTERELRARRGWHESCDDRFDHACPRFDRSTPPRRLYGLVSFVTASRTREIGVRPVDLPTLACVAALALLAGAAAGLPARRAVRIEPAAALRHD